MKFKPLLGSDLSGHLGGIVAAHNTYGPYFRSRGRPVNPRSPAQQLQRAAVAFVAQSWRGLAGSDQTAWAAATITKTSRKGDRTILSGQAAFMYVNTIRQRIGLSIFSSPPSGAPGAALTPPTLTFTSATTIDAVFSADTWNGPNGGVIISAALLVSEGITFRRPNRACTSLINPGTGTVSITLPFAVPISARARLTCHATGPDGRQSTYVDVEAVNPSFAPPPPALLRVLEVTLVGTKKFLWRFDGPVTVTPGPDLNLVIDGDASGVAAVDGTTGALVTYTTVATTPKTWTIPATPATISQPVLVPETGTTD